MAESEAIIGYLTTIEVEATAGLFDYVELAEVTDITPPSESVDSVDVTHMQSPEVKREFIPGMTDPGEVSLDMNFLPGSPGDILIRAWRSASERRNVRITFPNDITWSFLAFPTGYSPAVPNEDKMTATLTCKVASSTVTGDGRVGQLDFSNPDNSGWA
jgi:hypothetical protein